MKCLPPCSPDGHPIEPVFARLNGLLRKAPEPTYENLRRTVGQLIAHFHADECLNFLKVQVMSPTKR